MAVTTLATMRAAVSDWVARTDLTDAQVNNFLDLAENEIVNGVYGPDGRVIVPPLRVKQMETRDAGFYLSGEYTDLPEGFLGFRAVKFVASPNQKLEYVTPAYFDATILSTDTTSDVAAYTIVGDQLRVGPGAAANDQLDIVYYLQPPNLVATGSNWICTSYPNTYLYGALRHLAVYCGMDGKLAFFQSAFIATLAGLHASEKSTLFSGVNLSQNTIGVTKT